ncbi:HTTM domain-containing protein [Adhaeretor mobilis]|uniref:Vitamin K-dependent gamma-carboxylase n=1 Tax=Adhaeretor mobilis TaxID=1930276 RepID=A0A517MZ97_9BACT|nr:HTTM domain-containing protein [Adhaeretor mobilis]QDT00209.1 Vitamin K-dependent gamma-carboxylase [Adhaeretor mobilis]
MIRPFAPVRNYLVELWQAWNRFWFAPTDPATLSLIRVLGGAMLLYTHFIWSLDLEAFIGPEGWVPVAYLRDNVLVLPGDDSKQLTVWSVFFWIKSTWVLWVVHLFALVVFACLMLGLFSRTAAVLAWLLAISYATRVTPGSYFGLDKANVMLATYLMLGPCGARYSLDRIWRLRKGKEVSSEHSPSANLAVRLLQLHLCIVYLFSGLAKSQGATWQGGTAVWYAMASLEYQSIDMTWLAGWPLLVALLTHVTVFWEVFYCCLVWNRFTRPIVLWIAFAVHGGIALFMGMKTFGFAMLIANLAFISPEAVRRWVDPLASRVSLALVGQKVD